MPLISKTDLHYTYYSWTVLAEDDPKISGIPDSTLLNRMEGYEILYFISAFAKHHGLTQKGHATKIEKMIHEWVPNDIHAQKNIQEWIEKNWYNRLYSH